MTIHNYQKDLWVDAFFGSHGEANCHQLANHLHVAKRHHRTWKAALKDADPGISDLVKDFMEQNAGGQWTPSGGSALDLPPIPALRTPTPNTQQDDDSQNNQPDPQDQNRDNGNGQEKKRNIPWVPILIGLIVLSCILSCIAAVVVGGGMGILNLGTQIGLSADEEQLSEQIQEEWKNPIASPTPEITPTPGLLDGYDPDFKRALEGYDLESIDFDEFLTLVEENGLDPKNLTWRDIPKVEALLETMMEPSLEATPTPDPLEGMDTDFLRAIEGYDLSNIDFEEFLALLEENGLDPKDLTWRDVPTVQQLLDTMLNPALEALSNPEDLLEGLNPDLVKAIEDFASEQEFDLNTLTEEMLEEFETLAEEAGLDLNNVTWRDVDTIKELLETLVSP